MTVQTCHRCDQTTDQPVEVAVIHAASGPGHTVWACPDCAPPIPAAQAPAARVDSRRSGALKRTS